VRTRLAAVAAATALVALTVGCSSDEEPAAQPSSTTTAAPAPSTTTASATTPPPTTEANQVISVAVTAGTVTPAPAAVDVTLGSTVVIEVTSDVVDELHVHGYDKTLALPAGQPARLELPATIPGQFEVELHEGGQLLFTLRVS